MSTPVTLADLPDALGGFPWGYLVTVSDDLRAHSLAVPTDWRAGALHMQAGRGTRANATVGRFAQMVRYFCGRGGGSPATFRQPSIAIAEVAGAERVHEVVGDLASGQGVAKRRFVANVDRAGFGADDLRRVARDHDDVVIGRGECDRQRPSDETAGPYHCDAQALTVYHVRDAICTLSHSDLHDLRRHLPRSSAFSTADVRYA